MNTIPGPVVLVGHSYGGFVITDAATQSPNVIPPAELRAMAERAGSHIVQVPAGHLSLITQPKAVANTIIEAAQSIG